MIAASAPVGIEAAPYYADIAEGPDGAEAWWVRAQDGTRLRAGLWPHGDATGTKGTIIMFPGRTEYVEKYGHLARDAHIAGYGMVAFDWRGQGLADRPAHRRDMGHVISFDAYRQDVAAFRALLEDLDVPKPWYLIAHSMGGCIGLRALHDGFPVKAAAFTGPMWGLQMTPFLRRVSPVVLALSGPLGLSERFAPTTGPWQKMPFDDNPLTTDADEFAYMSRQTDLYPDLTLGGPSYAWVKSALQETRHLMSIDAPDVPAVGIVGEFERIISPQAVVARMATWPGGSFLQIERAEHEVLMESPPKRGQTLDAILHLFAQHPA